MDANWNVCLKAILEQEGGNDDDPDDHGGRTSRGIIQREYDAYRLHNGLPPHDVWKASDEEVAEIYRLSYWRPWCPEMPNGVDLVYYDMAVNSGPVQATKILQRALGVAADGHIGIITMSAVKAADPKGLIKQFSDSRRAFYRSLKQFRKYGRGWMNRTAAIEQQALKIA